MRSNHAGIPDGIRQYLKSIRLRVFLVFLSPILSNDSHYVPTAYTRRLASSSSRNGYPQPIWESGSLSSGTWLLVTFEIAQGTVRRRIKFSLGGGGGLSDVHEAQHSQALVAATAAASSLSAVVYTSVYWTVELNVGQAGFGYRPLNVSTKGIILQWFCV